MKKKVYKNHYLGLVYLFTIYETKLKAKQKQNPLNIQIKININVIYKPIPTRIFKYTTRNEVKCKYLKLADNCFSFKVRLFYFSWKTNLKGFKI